MRLISDFRDYYDRCFDGQGPVFTRTAVGAGPSRREQFTILQQAGFHIPPVGTVGDVMDSWWEREGRRINAVVAYEDEMAHCGEGKKLYHRYNADLKTESKMGYDERRELFCSAFLGNPLTPVPSESLRRLQIGSEVYWIEYRSTESWMSNVGEGDMDVIGHESGYHPKIKLPLFAIDFVIGKEMYAVDFNIAPGIKGSGVEKYCDAERVVTLIEGAL